MVLDRVAKGTGVAMLHRLGAGRQQRTGIGTAAMVVVGSRNTRRNGESTVCRRICRCNAELRTVGDGNVSVAGLLVLCGDDVLREVSGYEVES